MSAVPCIWIAPFGESEWSVSRGVLMEGVVSADTVIMRLPYQDEIEDFAKQIAANLRLPVYRVLPGHEPELVQEGAGQPSSQKTSEKK